MGLLHNVVFFSFLSLTFIWLLVIYSIVSTEHGESSSSLRDNTVSILTGHASLQDAANFASSEVAAAANFANSEVAAASKVAPGEIGSHILNYAQNLLPADYKPQSPAVTSPRRYSSAVQRLPPPSLGEVASNVTNYLHTLHARLGALAGPRIEPKDVWETYLEVTQDMMMKWDDHNKQNNRYHIPRDDGSIYVALGTYRDPYCPMTIKSLYKQAAHPEKLYVGLLQQNCFQEHCRTGVLAGGKIDDAPTDMDCYVEFCKSPEGIASNACNTGQVRLFNVNESESLGPYMARYIGAKFYQGEQYYLQIDSHSEFVNSWDEKLIKMVTDAPALKPVISAYPPDSTHKWQNTPGFTMCDSSFATAQIEWNIIRLSASAPPTKAPPVPNYAPFVAAGFLFAGAGFLHEVPFDPLLPWIFMGEEISMSARLWTSGYDLFSPTINVLNHYYVRRHYPKFWESVNRFFKKPIHNELVSMVIQRVKCMLDYPESKPEFIRPESVTFRLQNWGMGTERSYDVYREMVNIDTSSKKTVRNIWCHKGEWPEQAEIYKMSNRGELLQKRKDLYR